MKPQTPVSRSCGTCARAERVDWRTSRCVNAESPFCGKTRHNDRGCAWWVAKEDQTIEGKR